jgi:hypothetical protein
MRRPYLIGALRVGRVRGRRPRAQHVPETLMIPLVVTELDEFGDGVPTMHLPDRGISRSRHAS